MHRPGLLLGFALIELLVVVAILMILAAIVYPVYETATKRAEAIACVSQLAHIATAASLYAEDYDGFLVPARSSFGLPGTLGTSWDVLLEPYHRAEKLYLCPSDPGPTPANGTVCYKHSYGINLELTMRGGYNNSSLLLAQIDNPTRVILFFDMLSSARALGASYPLHGLSRVDARHHEGANFAFVDGHVKWLKPRQTDADPAANMWLP